MYRHQRSRAKGARQPEGVRYVGRGTRWGNPYTLDDYTQSEAIALYRSMILRMTDKELSAWIRPLRSCTGLSCFCALDQPCHADVLLKLLGEKA